MRRSEEYAINRTIYTTRQIATECHCSITTVYDHWSKTRGTDQEKFEALKRKMSEKSYKVGFTSILTVCQITHYDKTLIHNYLRSRDGLKYKTECLKHSESSVPVVMIQTCDLNDFINDLREYKKRSEAYKENCEAKKKVKSEKQEKKTLAELKKEHPLVKDERFFITSYFPNIDSYTILTECNYKRGEK